ncbi:hypothetical protein MMC09_003890 [Bachmanniomyces sp. S44760]|nr:hypothetical protein [Bachmanniomyces sp. S44760]
MTCPQYRRRPALVPSDAILSPQDALDVAIRRSGGISSLIQAAPVQRRRVGTTEHASKYQRAQTPSFQTSIQLLYPQQVCSHDKSAFTSHTTGQQFSADETTPSAETANQDNATDAGYRQMPDTLEAKPKTSSICECQARGFSAGSTTTNSTTTWSFSTRTPPERGERCYFDRSIFLSETNRSRAPKDDFEELSPMEQSSRGT